MRQILIIISLILISNNMLGLNSEGYNFETYFVNLKPITIIAKKYSVEETIEYKMAFELLKRCESFIPYLAWDINAMRGGYGTTFPKGTKKITPEMAINRANEIFLHCVNKLKKSYPHLDLHILCTLAVVDYNLSKDFMYYKNLHKAVINGDKYKIAKRLKRFVLSAKTITRQTYEERFMQGLSNRRDLEVEFLLADEDERNTLYIEYQRINTKKIKLRT